MTCGSPHPQRGESGIDIAQDLEVLGAHATECWARPTRGARYFVEAPIGLLVYDALGDRIQKWPG